MKKKESVRAKISKKSESKKFKFKSKVTVWKADYDKGDDKGAWRFAYLPVEISEKIHKIQQGKLRRGWGAVYVNAKIGKTKWATSIFPDRHSAAYLLPLKKEVRYEENLYDGININVSIEIWF